MEDSLNCIVCMDLANQAVETLCSCHLILCETPCAKKLSKCPTCKTELRFQPSFVTRRLIAGLPAKCEFCGLTVRRDDLDIHQKNCEKRPKKCGIPGCRFSGTGRVVLVNHLINDHTDRIEKRFEELTTVLGRDKWDEEAELKKKLDDAQLETSRKLMERSELEARLVAENLELSNRLGVATSHIAALETDLESQRGPGSRMGDQFGENTKCFCQKSHGIEISTNGRVAKQMIATGDRPRLAALTGRIRGLGTERFRVRLKGTDIYVGVALSGVAPENLYESKSAWLMYQRAQAVVLRSVRSVPNKPDIKHGGFIIVEVNSANKSIRFFPEGMAPSNEYELGLNDDDYKRLRFAVQLRYENDSVEIQLM